MRGEAVGALIRLKIPMFRKVAISKGWIKADGEINFTAAAREIGCEVSTVTRIYRGERACGGEFIANLLVAAAPWDFNDLFEVEVDDEQVPA